MKTKEKEIQKKIKELCELMDEDNKFFFFRKKGNVVDIALPNAKGNVSDNHVSAALASVIEAHILGNGNEGVDRLSEIIINAIEAVLGVSPIAGIKLAARFAGASILGLKMDLDKMTQDIDDDDEDCENCEFMKECDHDNAIKYRKEHGIPKPKKGKKCGRKVDVN